MWCHTRCRAVPDSDSPLDAQPFERLMIEDYADASADASADQTEPEEEEAATAVVRGTTAADLPPLQRVPERLRRLNASNSGGV